MKRDSFMPKSIFALVAGLMLTGIAMLPTAFADEKEKDERDMLACYTWSIFPDERFKLNVKEHSPLFEQEEEKNFKHSKQIAYSVHGKQIGTCGFDTMVAITGTVVVAKTNSYTDQQGAHMGLESHSVRADDSCGSITVDCTTDEDKAVPTVWTCFSRNDFGAFHGSSELIKVDEMRDERCSFFQNGSFTEDTSSEDTSSEDTSVTRASGLPMNSGRAQ